MIKIIDIPPYFWIILGCSNVKLFESEKWVKNDSYFDHMEDRGLLIEN